MVENTEQMYIDIPSNLLDEIQHNIECIIKDFDVPEENKMEVIKQINFIYTRTKYLSITDEMTGLSNRRYFESVFNQEFLRSSRYKTKLTLMIFDIDKFKNVNDTYGHSCGDFVLKQISNAALQTFRKTDYLFRIGGEEFAVLLPETDKFQAIIPLERFRKTVETLGLIFHDEKIDVTVSIGACELTPNISSTDVFFQLADEALYEAKNSGRNKVIFSNC